MQRIYHNNQIKIKTFLKENKNNIAHLFMKVIITKLPFAPCLATNATPGVMWRMKNYTETNKQSAPVGETAGFQVALHNIPVGCIWL